MRNNSNNNNFKIKRTTSHRTCDVLRNVRAYNERIGEEKYEMMLSNEFHVQFTFVPVKWFFVFQTNRTFTEKYKFVRKTSH